MLKRRILFVLWCIFTIIYFFMRADTASILLILFTVITVIFSYLLALSVRKNVSVSLSVPEVVSKYQKGCLKIELKNLSKIPVFFGVAVLHCQNQLTGSHKKIDASFYLGSKETDFIEIELESLYCGKMQIFVNELKFADIFGVFTIKNKTEASDELLIIPSDEKVENKNLEYAMMADKGKIAGSEKFGIVEYTPEMSYRLIHWKLSSKLDDMLARAEEKIGAVYSSIFIETSIEETHSSLYSKVVDERLEMAYLTSKNMCELNIGHKFIFYSDEEKCFKEIAVCNTDDLYKALYTLLGIKFVIKDSLSFNEYTPQNNEAMLSITAYITDELSYKQEDVSDGQGFIPIYKETKTEYKEENVPG